MEELKFSARAHDKILKVARTISGFSRERIHRSGTYCRGSGLQIFRQANFLKNVPMKNQQSVPT